MDFKNGSPPRFDRTDHVSMTDEDERALEAIRRQLDMEFAHSTEPVVVIAPAAPRRRVRAVTVLGVLLVCGSAGAAAMLVTPVYRAYLAQPSVETASRTATPAPAPVPASVPDIVADARPSSPAQPAPRAQAITTRPADPGVPDVIRVRAETPASRAPAAAPAVFAAAAPPEALVTAPVAPRVDVPSPPEHGAQAATAPSTSRLPRESVAAALAPLPLVEVASEHVRAAWGTVKERAARASGELRPGAGSGPEAP